jgi:hypothetical protein
MGLDISEEISKQSAEGAAWFFLITYSQNMRREKLKETRNSLVRL